MMAILEDVGTTIGELLADRHEFYLINVGDREDGDRDENAEYYLYSDGLHVLLGRFRKDYKEEYEAGRYIGGHYVNDYYKPTVGCHVSGHCRGGVWIDGKGWHKVQIGWILVPVLDVFVGPRSIVEGKSFTSPILDEKLSNNDGGFVGLRKGSKLRMEWCDPLA